VSVFQLFNTAASKAREVKVPQFLSHKRLIKRRIRSTSQELLRKREEVRQIKDELCAEKPREQRIERKQRKKKVQQEIFQLERELLRLEEELGTVKEQAQGVPGEPTTLRAEGEESQTGALPDFAIIGVMKGGTTSLYHLLVQHPYVEPAAKKELHYFDVLIEDEDVEWYRRCFPAPRWKDGRRTITGEATPGYMSHPLAPERMAKVVPQTRLIALLRNPVDRAYSDYQQVVRKGRESRTFEEAVEEAINLDKKLSLVKEDKTSDHDNRAYADETTRYGYLYRSIYADHLRRWSNLFGDEQMLVLKSEDFFERTPETLKLVLDFLRLPEWEPEASEIVPKKRNEGHYQRGMDPATRRRLEEFFEPHNQRLYEYLGRDFGW
jgi:hypothetical protein